MSESDVLSAMPMVMSRDDLIAALEAAPRASQGLDRRIALHVGWVCLAPGQRKGMHVNRSKHREWFHPDDVIGGHPVIDSLHGTEIWRDPPKFTGSLDAALTLYAVPPERIPSIPLQACMEALKERTP